MLELQCNNNNNNNNNITLFREGLKYLQAK